MNNFTQPCQAWQTLMDLDPDYYSFAITLKKCGGCNTCDYLSDGSCVKPDE